MAVQVHLDTDIGGDTDDLCALALLLGSPECDLVGITTCADAEGFRRGFALHALGLAGRPEIPVATGARGFINGIEHYPRAQDSRYWPGVEPIAPSAPGMALDLLEASARAGATIVAIGPFTNLALLETLRPGAFEHSPVVVLGGYTGMPPVGVPQWPPGYDYNVQSDRAAARIVYERLNPLVATLNVTLATSLRRRDLPTLREGGPLSRLMARQAELHAEEHRMADRARRHHRLAPDILNFQYDSVACAAALGLSTVEVAEEPHRLDTDGEDLILTRDEAGRIRRFVTRIETEEFAKDWLERVRAL